MGAIKRISRGVNDKEQLYQYKIWINYDIPQVTIQLGMWLLHFGVHNGNLNNKTNYATRFVGGY